MVQTMFKSLLVVKVQDTISSAFSVQWSTKTRGNFVTITCHESRLEP